MDFELRTAHDHMDNIQIRLHDSQTAENTVPT